MSSKDRFEIVQEGTDRFEAVLKDLFKDDALGLLCGSAVSIFPPTNLQGGKPTSEAVANCLCDAAGVSRKHFGPAIKSAAFEALLQRHPANSRLMAIVSGYFLRYGEPTGAETVAFNPQHQAIATLLADNRVGGIVTTNYDTCLEDAYEAVSKSKCRVMVRQKDPFGPHPLFKLHGCARDPESLIFSLEQEGRMPHWKRRRLKTVLGRRFLVVGYSGLDFEICPQLHSLRADQIYWLARRKADGLPDLTSNARKVLNKKGRCGTVICVSDMRTFLSRWSGISDQPLRKSRRRPPLLSEQLLGVLSPSERRLWAARTFSMLSVPVAAVSAIEAECRAGTRDLMLSYDFERARLGALNHQMLYYQNADANLALSADASLSPARRTSHLSGEAGAMSMAGDFGRSRDALARATDMARGIDQPKEKESAAQNIAWIALLLEKDARQKDDEAMAQELLRRFRSLQKRAETVGNHALVDLCEQEISFLATGNVKDRKSGRERPAGQIFEQVGNYVGQMTALRERLAKAISSEKGREARTIIEDLVKQCLIGVEKMRLYGLPEWRLLKTLIDVEPKRRNRLRLYRQFELSLFRCEYHPSYASAQIVEAQTALSNPKAIAT